jgi:hypothetical protein
MNEIQVSGEIGLARMNRITYEAGLTNCERGLTPTLRAIGLGLNLTGVVGFKNTSFCVHHF